MTVSDFLERSSPAARGARRRDALVGSAPFCFLISDIAAFAAASCAWIFWLGVFPVTGAEMAAHQDDVWSVLLPMLTLGALTVSVFVFGQLYSRIGWEIQELALILAGCLLLGVSNFAWQHNLSPGHVFDPAEATMIFVFWGAVAGSVAVGRMALRATALGRAILKTPCVLVGDAKNAPAIVAQSGASRAALPDVLAHWSLGDAERLDPEALEARIARVARRAGVEPSKVEILLVPGALQLRRVDALLERLHQLDRSYSMILPFSGMPEHGTGLRAVPGAQFVVLDHQRRGSQTKLLSLKRALDVLGALLILIPAAPVFLAISVALMLENGPVFYSQLRVGRNGKRFRCLKFRSMAPNADAVLQDYLDANPDARREWMAHQKLENDPRITSTGRFLRKTSLDELPQLINVLIGDMSLVGPRPIVAPEIEGFPGDREYSESPDFRHYASFRPGITGLWQVSGRAKLAYDARRRLDRWYARNWSLELDLSVLLQTFRAVLARTGT